MLFHFLSLWCFPAQYRYFFRVDSLGGQLRMAQQFSSLHLHFPQSKHRLAAPWLDLSCRSWITQKQDSIQSKSSSRSTSFLVESTQEKFEVTYKSPNVPEVTWVFFSFNIPGIGSRTRPWGIPVRSQHFRRGSFSGFHHQRYKSSAGSSYRWYFNRHSGTQPS